MVEEWRPVWGWDVEVSSLGNVRRKGVANLRKPQVSRHNGYQMLWLHNKGAAKHFCVHTLVCVAFHGPRPRGHEVRHRDGDKLNNKADNLCWATKRQNAADRRRHATHCRGHKHPSAHLTDDLAFAIRLKWLEAKSGSRYVPKGWLQAMADEYGVTHSVIRHITEGRSYPDAMPDGFRPRCRVVIPADTSP
jgi:hypothetical protein